MKWILNSSTKGQLLYGFGTILLMLVILISITYINISSLVKSQNIIYNKNMPEVINLIELRSDQNAIRALMLEKILTTDRDDQKIIDKDIEERSEEINKALKTVIELENDDTESLKRLKEVQSLILAYREGRELQNKLIRQGRIAEARALGCGIQSERFEKIRLISK